VTLDCALLMRDIPVTWTAIQPTFSPTSVTTSRLPEQYDTLC